MRVKRLPVVLAGNLLAVAAFAALYGYTVNDRPPESLGDAMFWAFVLIPVLAIPLRVIAAAAGAYVRRKIAQSSHREGHA